MLVNFNTPNVNGFLSHKGYGDFTARRADGNKESGKNQYDKIELTNEKVKEAIDDLQIKEVAKKIKSHPFPDGIAELLAEKMVKGWGALVN